jgi:hypothetical protein
MIVKQVAAAGLLLNLSLMLGSCSPVAGLVADHWPHFAGGEPHGIPPRPGAPGYDEFIAHGQPSRAAQPAAADAKPAAADQEPAAGGEKPAAMDATTDAQAAPSGDRPPSDSNVVQGGLY